MNNPKLDALLAADGGIGKTTLWCHIIAALSSGRRCILDPEDCEREPMEVAFLTTEDSVRKKLKRKLSIAGAAMSNIYTVDSAEGGEAFLRSLKFGSEEMEKFVRDSRYKLYVFDPVQGYIPPNLNMGSRNAMRDCLAPLISLGEETGATFLIVAHTNKRKGAFGRDRIADSADLWDISRSVMMAGYTEEQGVRYLSNEKNNYDSLKETLLFSIDGDGQIVPEGTSWKRDREYQQESQFVIAAPKREECTRWLLNRLEAAEGELPVTRLESEATAAGFSRTTLRNAKDALKKDGYIAYRQSYSEGKRQWSLLLLKSPDKEKGAARASAVWPRAKGQMTEETVQDKAFVICPEGQVASDAAYHLRVRANETARRINTVPRHLSRRPALTRPVSFDPLPLSNIPACDILSSLYHRAQYKKGDALCLIPRKNIPISPKP